MSISKSYTPEVMANIRALLDQGLSRAKVGAKLGIPKGSVSRLTWGYKSPNPPPASPPKSKAPAPEPKKAQAVKTAEVKKAKASKPAKPSGKPKTYATPDDFYKALNEKLDLPVSDMKDGEMKTTVVKVSYIDQVDVPSQEDAEEFLEKALSGKMADTGEARAALIEGADRWLKDYYYKHPEKLDELEDLTTVEDFYEELKKPHALRVREDGVMIETGVKKTFLETTTNPTFMKAMAFLKDVLRKRIAKTVKGEPIELVNMGKACSKFLNDYTLDVKLKSAEYVTMTNGFFDVVS
jgi:hypothetical protein